MLCKNGWSVIVLIFRKYLKRSSFLVKFFAVGLPLLRINFFTNVFSDVLAKSVNNLYYMTTEHLFRRTPILCRSPFIDCLHKYHPKLIFIKYLFLNFSLDLKQFLFSQNGNSVMKFILFCVKIIIIIMKCPKYQRS